MSALSGTRRQAVAALVATGKTLLDEGRPAEASAALSEALDLNPSHPRARLFYGWAQFLTAGDDPGRLDYAGANLQAAVQFLATDAQAHQYMALFYQATGEMERRYHHERMAEALTSDATSAVHAVLQREIDAVPRFAPALRRLAHFLKTDE